MRVHPSSHPPRRVSGEFTLAVGRAADGMIISSWRRMSAHMWTGDGEAAALETDRHLRCLLYM